MLCTIQSIMFIIIKSISYTLIPLPYGCLQTWVNSLPQYALAVMRLKRAKETSDLGHSSYFIIHIWDQSCWYFKWKLSLWGIWLYNHYCLMREDPIYCHMTWRRLSIYNDATSYVEQNYLSLQWVCALFIYISNLDILLILYNNVFPMS